MRKPLILLAVLVAGAVASIAFGRRALAEGAAKPASLVEFTAGGAMKRPHGYRRWVQVGTPLTPNDMNDGEAPFPEFHSVYIDPASFEHYEKTGEFRDGTVLVKELVSVGSKKATSGDGYFMGDFVGLEVSIKDRARFPGEPGNWAYFTFGHSYPLKDVVKRNATASCNECHATSARQDYVFTQYYPVIRGADPRK